MKDITKQEWKELTANDENAVIIDVRTADEVAEGMIPNALHHDIFKPQELMAALEKMDKSKNYYIYCRSGGRSGQACQIMNQMGFETTYNLLGGFGEWDGDTA
ncbi:rhodanese-like domain-containing protein [Nonlabens mediterrranea]|uniref:Rhodanese-like domain-containing protein n=1 Tax=Nonlabens mediterrranea TaxID=1419947 RepID=A0ABS0A1H1_9FLAO|nr:rhodanese-like domain-containing protein [Nonlabens mediterrranea]MBF4984216.1 rhodanese-like domain-containing protein [Nonlabens mediterrranea]